MLILSLLALLQSGGLPQQGDAAGQGGSPSDDEIVVTGRRLPKSLDGATPTEELSQERLSTYGARSINELIERLKAERGGPPFSIVVNGRRLSSLADIGELPAEALASIELFPPGEGKRFGYAPNERLINLTLKKRFRSLSLDMGGSGPTDGGGESVTDTLRGADIAGDRRLNGSIEVRAAAELLASERRRHADTAAGDQSLIPRSRMATANLGLSRPLGSGTLDIGLAGGLTRSSRQRTGTGRQSDDGKTADLSASYNLATGAMFGFVTANVNAGSSRSRIEAPCPPGRTPCVLQDIVTDTLAASFAGTMSGKIATLPAGDVRLDLSLQRNAAWTGTRERSNADERKTGYGANTGRAGLSVPLVTPKSRPFGFLGSLSVAPSVDYNTVDGIGGAMGANVSGNWMPLASLMFNAVVGRRASLPSNDQLNAPERTLVGVTVYDYRAAALVPVEQIVGGAPLARQSTRDLQLAANYDTAFGKTMFTAYVTYSSTTTDRPPFALNEPSPFFERAFPERFVRDAAGTLVRVDTRPFSALRESNASVAASASLSGNLDETGGDAVNWSVNVGGQWQLRQSLSLAAGVPVIDTLATPLSLSTGVRGRRQWTANLRVNGRKLGGDLSANLTSGLAASVFEDATTGIRVAPLARIDATIFRQWRGSAGGSPAAGPGYRLELAIRNAFNQRPRIETFTTAATTRLDPYLLDPLGRTVSLLLRLPLGGGR